jgi:hypothetical protein
MIEAQSRYINGLITPILSARQQNKSLSLSPKASKVIAYNERVQEVLLKSSFNDPNCNSWYKNEAGLITNNWSGTVIEYQKMLARVDFEDYEVEGTDVQIVREKSVVELGRVHEETMVSDRVIAAMGILSVGAVAAGFVLRNSKYLSGMRVR